MWSPFDSSSIVKPDVNPCLPEMSRRIYTQKFTPICVGSEDMDSFHVPGLELFPPTGEYEDEFSCFRQVVPPGRE